MSDIEPASEQPPRDPWRHVKALWDPRAPAHRYVIALPLMCILGFGNYFCYDTPASLEKPIKEAMHIDSSRYTTLYALYSWPNVIMCFFGGLLIDKVLGIRLGAVIFLSLLVMGQSLFAFGAFADAFWLMQLGRFVYGLGGESLSVAQNAYVVAWFKKSELNTMFGLQITISRAGSALALNVMEPIFESQRRHFDIQTAVGWALLIAVLTCVISLVAAVVLAFLDKRAERILERPVQSSDEISIKDAVNFYPEYWLLSFICITFYMTIFPFISIGSGFLQHKWGLTENNANQWNSVTYLIAAFISPLIGILVDKVGRNLNFLLMASIMVMISHFLLAVSSIAQWFPIIMMGVGYSIMCSALWPMVALVVPQQQIGTAYGVMQAIQNFGLAITSNIVGYLVDAKGYIMVELFFVFWVGVAVTLSCVLIFMDHGKMGVLNKSAKDREALKRLSER